MKPIGNKTVKKGGEGVGGGYVLIGSDNSGVNKRVLEGIGRKLFGLLVGDENGVKKKGRKKKMERKKEKTPVRGW